MFSGIVQTTAKLFEFQDKKLTFHQIEDDSFLHDVKTGSSIAVNGVCLTVIDQNEGSFSAEVMPETLKKTNLGALNTGDRVNLEKALQANGRFEGHIMQGHVDSVGNIVRLEEEENSYLIYIEFPQILSKYIVPKGSIAVNGISLTVIDVTKNIFSIGIIPHTWEVTMLSDIKVSDTVNLEVDIIAKYVEKMIT